MDLPCHFIPRINQCIELIEIEGGIEVRSHELMSWHADQPSRQFSFQRSKYIQRSSSRSSSIISEFFLNTCQGNQMIGHSSSRPVFTHEQSSKIHPLLLPPQFRDPCLAGSLPSHAPFLGTSVSGVGWGRHEVQGYGIQIINCREKTYPNATYCKEAWHLLIDVTFARGSAKVQTSRTDQNLSQLPSTYSLVSLGK